MTTPSTALKVSPIVPSGLLTPAQKRFNTLTRQIEQARQKLSAWREQIPVFVRTFEERTAAVGRLIEAAQATWARELDRLLDEEGWTKRERSGLREMLCEMLRHLVEGTDEPDAQLRALYDKHSALPFAQVLEQERRVHEQERQDFADMIKVVTGVDLGEDALKHGDDEEALIKRLRQKMAEQPYPGNRFNPYAGMPGSKAQKAKQAKAQAKKQSLAELASLSLRDIYRKLVSALHPDREPDPKKREVRTALMQRANQAYDQKDLLGLLTLQLEIAQICTNDIAATAPERLKLYNIALAEQLTDMQAELNRIEFDFRMEFDVPGSMALSPDKLGKVLEMHVAELRRSKTILERELTTFKDRAATKRWLKKEMAQAEVEPMMEEEFYKWGR